MTPFGVGLSPGSGASLRKCCARSHSNTGDEIALCKTTGAEQSRNRVISLEGLQTLKIGFPCCMGSIIFFASHAAHGRPLHLGQCDDRAPLYRSADRHCSSRRTSSRAAAEKARSEGPREALVLLLLHEVVCIRACLYIPRRSPHDSGQETCIRVGLLGVRARAVRLRSATSVHKKAGVPPRCGSLLRERCA